MSYPLLDRLEAPGDVRNLPVAELPQLCEEIRSFLIESVSNTGGHLASNLGVVELTVALHHTLDLPQDKILFDVGHQCYTHKLLTGRRAGFAALRQLEGISGFPSPAESEYDTFVAGHGSAALSAAIGIARAKKLKNEPGRVVVIVGDGAFTGGMVYEGMNNIALLNNLVVILNDNKMSIGKNVGMIANYLTKLRTDPAYFHAKARMETVLGCIPLVGQGLVRLLQNGKQLIRRWLYHSTMFEQMGFQYIGPVDGHDVAGLCRLFENMKEQFAPLFIHVVTQKGKGLKPAEDNPGEFHNVSAFDLDHLTNPELSPEDSFSVCFGRKLARLGKDEPRLCAITAAMKYGTGLQYFKHRFADRFFDVGMAEQHAVTFAAGLASQGLLPVVAIYSTFFQRAYDQIIHDVVLMRLPVLFAVDRAGFVPGDGETHQGIYDVAFFAQAGIPVYAPANYQELEYWLEELVKNPDGPRAIRYPRGKEIYPLAALGCSGKALDLLPAPRRQGKADLLLISYGAMTEEILSAAETLRADGMAVDCCKLTRLFPLPEPELLPLVRQYKAILLAEDTIAAGGIGRQVAALLQGAGWRGQYVPLAANNIDLPHATVQQMRAVQGLDAASILEMVHLMMPDGEGTP